MYHPTKGEVVNAPGMPPMYDYEWTPQEVFIDTHPSIALVLKMRDDYCPLAHTGNTPKSYVHVRIYVRRVSSLYL